MTKLQIQLTKTKEGMLAQSEDNPEIIVTGKNKTEIKTKLKEIITGYVQAFPESKDQFFENGKMLEADFNKVQWV